MLLKVYLYAYIQCMLKHLAELRYRQFWLYSHT